MALVDWAVRFAAEKEWLAKMAKLSKHLRAVKAAKAYETAEQTKKIINKFLFR